MAFEILPAIDLMGGRVVRLRRGRFDDATVHGDAPVATAEALVGAGARWLHVVDLEGAKDGRPVHVREIELIVRAVGGVAAVEVGGGVRDEATAAWLLGLGAARVILGTAALQDPGLADRIVKRHGASSIAVAIDVRDGRAVGRGWQDEGAAVDALAAVDRLARVGVRTFEVTAIERDGTLDGPDLELLRGIVAQDAGEVIASGGIRSVEDLEAVRDAGCAGAIVGRAIYEGRLDLAASLARLDGGVAGQGRGVAGPGRDSA